VLLVSTFTLIVLVGASELLLQEITIGVLPSPVMVIELGMSIV